VRRIIGANPELAADLGQIDSSAPQTVIDFVNWAHTTAPAQRYGLILWSHGSGWEPSEMIRQAQQRRAFVPVTEAELTNRGLEDEGRQIFFSTTLRELLARSTPPERAICFDDGSGHALDTIELGQVVSQATQILGQPIDLLGMNACQMSNIEVAYQLRDHVQIYIASPEDMPVQSWPYADILTRLAAQPTLDRAALGQMIVERYCTYYRNKALPWGRGGYPQGATLAAIRADRIAPLAAETRTLAAALMANIDEQIQMIWDAHRATHAFKFRLYDLASFCRALSAQSGIADAIAQAARNVLLAIEDPAFRLAYTYTAAAYATTSGLSTYLMLPDPGRRLSPYYYQTDYASATGWGAFLSAYHTATPF
jgi:hypothetical protein